MISRKNKKNTYMDTPLIQIYDKYMKLTLKAPITTAADNIFKYFFLIFQRKQALICYVNRLLGRRFT